ncbi:hypothetical protein [Arvimicrobium flavum]|uniref:hypothetical protein n=1 Tax=Arvimicrobium flavum TaxID=3393320 RepID=UPI00237A1882|nr:hypothetical protein [Mesorhizobium shangrilense]
MSERTMLDELLGDPMTRLVMARDQVNPDALRRMLMERARPRAANSDVPAAHVISQVCCMHSPLMTECRC